MVTSVRLEMRRQIRDPIGEERNLNLRRSGVRGVPSIRLHEFLCALLDDCHPALSDSVLSRFVLFEAAYLTCSFHRRKGAASLGEQPHESPPGCSKPHLDHRGHPARAIQDQRRLPGFPGHKRPQGILLPVAEPRKPSLIDR